MTAPLGRREFFALEAGEYLERLALAVGGQAPPDAEDLVRYARALRGAALMAGPPGYAIAAAAIESVAKGYKEGSLGWNAAIAEQISHVVEECKSLLRKLREWSDLDVQRCERIAERLDRLSGTDAARLLPRGNAGEELSAGARAFVAREAAAVAATLEQVADAVDRFPVVGSAGPVRERLQPLRGLGALPGLSPLPELLESLDLTIAWAGRGGAWPKGSGQAFRATAAALARMARDIAELGVPQTDSSEVLRAAELLREAFANDDDVVPVARLFQDGDTAPVVHRGAPPVPAAVPVDQTVELVSLSDRLRHAGAFGGGEGSRTARTFTLQALVIALRGLPMSPSVRVATAPFFARLDRETMAGRFAPELLERAANALSAAAGPSGIGGLGAALAPLAAEFDRLGGSPPVALASEAEAGSGDVEIVPIELLAPDTEAPVVPIESLLLPPYLPFEQSFSTFFQLVTGVGARPTVAAPVPIDELLYRGRRALERADLVRRELDAALRVRRDLASIETLLGELLDLVPLALDDRR